MQCDFQAIYASGIQGKAGLSPEVLAEDLGPLFESIIRCIPGPHIEKDGALQMLVSGRSFITFQASICLCCLSVCDITSSNAAKLCDGNFWDSG